MKCHKQNGMMVLNSEGHQSGIIDGELSPDDLRYVSKERRSEEVAQL